MLLVNVNGREIEEGYKSYEPTHHKKYMRVLRIRGRNKPVYAEAARTLGRPMAEQGIGLVYGGASVGLMGEIARAASCSRRARHGIQPANLPAHELPLRGCRN